MDPTYPLYSIFAFICFILVLSPLPWHLQAWNVGTCMYMLWTSTVCLIWFINSLIWRNNAIDWAPIYCDITTRIVIGAGVAIPACGLCIQRRLYCVTKQLGSLTQQEKLKAVIVDMLITLGFPLFIIGIAYISQGHRYDIFEDVGCTFHIHDAWPAFLTYYMWPLTIALISAVYCGMNLRTIYRRRSALNKFNLADSTLPAKIYMRLLYLSCTEIVFTIPFASWVLYTDIINIAPYISWADTHSFFHLVWAYPSIIWHNEKELRPIVEFYRWNIIICAIVFIGFFTFADESRRNYGILFGRLMKWCGCSRSRSTANGHLLPMFENRIDSSATAPSFTVSLPSTLDDKFDELKTMEFDGHISASRMSISLDSQGSSSIESSPSSDYKTLL
ncbi:STE3-domain-containing protein [Rickenella mellea]|uniref:STE3-domain-containing protein n=1 Tax=Rickenella mellea TaxID=50990 RepID=A0A4Y7PPE0_9AGAM|nr:STE3-domain-containing protein [Rickenella mellea]